MKKTSMSIMYDDEKLNAIRLYMSQRDLDFKEELEKSVDALYAKYVPANVREFIDMKGSQVKTPKPKSQSHRKKIQSRGGNLKNQNFGIEIEMTGITRSTAAKVIAGYFYTNATHVGGCYDAYSVRDNDGRMWKIMRDASVRCENRSGQNASSLYSVEFVTPICNYDDIETIQELVRKLRGAGARVNSSCGLHCHINAAPHTPKTLRNIVNIMAAKEDLLYKALKVNVSREHYCQKMDTRFLDEINNRPPMSMEQIKSMWYDGEDYSYRHYDDTRYHALNLHSVFYKGTIEFRLFNSTLHAGEVKSAIQLCLAISHQALIQKSARHAKTVSDNEKYTFRTWLLRLGLIGDEFKTARHHLLKNLDGNIAWKDPAQAEKQKERLAQQRAIEIINTNENININEPEVNPVPMMNRKILRVLL